MIIIVLLNEREQFKANEITQIKNIIEKFFENQKNVEILILKKKDLQLNPLT